MLRGSGITKSNRKKYNVNSTMEQKALPSVKSRPSRSIVDEDDVHFVIDSSDIDFSNPLPNEKSIELSRKTYSKRNPIVLHPFIPQDSLEPFRGSISLKEKAHSTLALKCSSAALSGSKSLPRKRKKDFDSMHDSKSLVPRKVQKKNMSLNRKSTSQSCNAKVPKQPSQSKSLETTLMKREDSDSDVEILGVYKHPATLGASSDLSSARKLTNAQSQSSSKKNSRCFESESNDNEVVMNEADIAPYMPTNPVVFPDMSSRTNSMRWLSANGTIAVSPYESNVSEENGTQGKTTNDQHLFFPEMKLNRKNKSNCKRELQKLYENLNEISWAHESSFKNLLRGSDSDRHSERSYGRIAGTGKNLRKIKAIPENAVKAKKVQKANTANILAKKKSKMARLNHKLKPKPISKGNTFPVIKKVKVEKQIAVNKDKKTITAKAKVDNLEDCTNEETDILYSLNPAATKAKFESSKPNPNNVAKTKPSISKAKSNGQILKNGVSKLKPDVQKLKSSISKLKPNGQKIKANIFKLKLETQKTKTDSLKLKPDGPKAKSNALKLKPDGQKLKSNMLKLKSEENFKKSVAQIKPEYSPPSTSGVQNVSCSTKNASSSKNGGKTSDVKNFFKNLDTSNFGFSKEVQWLQGFLDENEHLYSAVQKGSKLRVRLQPLEQTNLWNSEFYEDFRRHFLDQALRKAIENRDRDSITVMYQELLESFMNSQASNSGKKKRPEEESLRSSVRQSEGAFRYKEIVVKKHPNYMQVVLVPNDVKQNSLTAEAMKELKDAFLLAKKDPNCHAVLLNSSGAYFCTGIDLAPLIGSNKKQAAEEISNAMRDLVLTLGMFTKPVIAAVNGAAVGFGVSILTYCDVVLASDKATFCLPATKIGYIPEGGITLTLPQVVGSSVASEMFLQGRRLTAEQAFRHGLVSEVLWPTKLMNEVMPRLKTIISQPLQAMEATKAMVRCHLWDKLKSHVDRERRLLCEHWLGAECQANIKALLQTGWLSD